MLPLMWKQKKKGISHCNPPAPGPIIWWSAKFSKHGGLSYNSLLICMCKFCILANLSFTHAERSSQGPSQSWLASCYPPLEQIHAHLMLPHVWLCAQVPSCFHPECTYQKHVTSRLSNSSTLCELYECDIGYSFTYNRRCFSITKTK